jgi:outer membrane immunogenic protein
MTRLLFAGGLILAALGQAMMGQALAADLPEAPPPPMAPATYMPVMPVYNWGGMYFGVNGGYGFGDSNWTFPVGTTGNFKTNGWTAGATAGVNLQTEAFVFGLESDFDMMGMKGTAPCNPANCETRQDWLFTVRGRAGYAMDRFMVYGTAGGAFGDILANTSPGSTSFASTTKAGWVAGAGAEYAFADCWTARVEYLYVDLQNGTFSGATGNISVKYDANLIRAGIDYKFR